MIDLQYKNKVIVMFKENGFDRIKAFNDFDDLETWVKGKGNSE